MNRLKGVHGLRGIAALAVVAFHGSHLSGSFSSTLIAKAFEPLYLSVQLFFVISAFTLSYSRASRPMPLYEYAIRRFIRIAPLFWIVLAYICYRGGAQDPWAVFLNATFLFNLMPGYEASIVWAGWSVGVEMVFYALLPLLWFLLRSHAAWTGATLIAIAGSEWLWRLTYGHPELREHYAYFSILGNLPQFLFGVLAFRVYANATALAKSTLFIRCVAIASVLAVSLLLLKPGLVPQTGLRMSLIGAAFAAMCLWQAWHPSRWLASRPLAWIADRSYGIYLLHSLVLVTLEPLYSRIATVFGVSFGFFLSLLITFAIVLPAAHVSFRLIESPATAAGNKFVRWITQRSSTSKLSS
jgi:peptidoglycan/LPS O-acetylase OafA/YrhL